MEAYTKIDCYALHPDRNLAEVTLWVQPDDDWTPTRYRPPDWRVHLQMVFDFDPEHPVRTVWERPVAAAKEWTTAPPSGRNPPDGFEGSKKLSGTWPPGWPDRLNRS